MSDPAQSSQGDLATRTRAGNTQRDVRILGRRRAGRDARGLEAFINRVLDSQGAGSVSVSLKLTTDGVIRRLNRRFRGHDQATDVLSFEGFESPSGSAHLGDLVISVDTARRQARAAGLTLEREMHELTLHGVLHLLGHDHEIDDGAMNRLELVLRRRLLDREGPRS